MNTGANTLKADPQFVRTTLDEQLTTTTTTNDLNQRCSAITDAMITATTAVKSQNYSLPPKQATYTTCDEKLKELIRQRQQLPHNSAQRKTVSQKIRKQLQRTRRNDQELQIEQLIQSRQGLKHITDIKRHKGRDLIPSMTSREGTTTTDRQSIADIFATFYEDLYRCRSADDDPNNNADYQRHLHNIPLFSLEEVTIAVSQLRNGRCSDTTGLISKFFKNGGPTLQVK